MKKQIKARINWKKKYESSEKELGESKQARLEEHRNYVKQYKDTTQTKNFWIGVLALIIVMCVIVIIVTQNELTQRDTRIILLASANNYAVNEVRNCRADLETMTNLYNEEYYEVITTEKASNGIFSDCCYPSDCVESKNNPKDCKCEYMVMCTTNLWG